MNETTSLALDVGGQSVLGLMVDDQARVVTKARQTLETHEDGVRVEQDPEQVVCAIQAVIDEALYEAPGPERLETTRAALAVQRGSIVCWDRETGAALSPVLSWRDRRSLPRLEHLNAQAEAIRQRSGLRFSPYAGAPKIAWCLSEIPAVREASENGRLACGPLGSFLLARLTEDGPLRVDHTLAQRSLLWSRRNFDWDPWLLERFGLPLNILPPVVPSRSHHGRLRGQHSNVSLDLLIGDQNCLPYINGQPDPDTLYINLGTGAFLLRPMLKPVDDPRFQCTLLDESNGGRWALEGSVHGAASALNWLKRKHAIDIAPDDWSDLIQGIGTPPLFLNRIDGLGSPWWNPGRACRFHDVENTTQHSAQARLLAILESIAFLIRANVDAMNENLPRPQRIVICGGLSRSNLLCSLISDLLQCNLHRLVSVEGTALGLWCRLKNCALPPAHFEVIQCGAGRLLEERYRVWLKLIVEDADL